MSKRKSGKAKARRELKEEYDLTPNGDQRSLRIEDLDLNDATKRAVNYDKDVLQPEQLEKAEKVVDEFDEIIETEKQLLELFNPDRLKLEVIFPTNGSNKLLKFNIRNVEPTDDLQSLQIDLSVYSELSDLERNVMEKGATEPEELSPSEVRLYEKTTTKLEGKLAGTLLEQVHNVLVTYVTPPTGTKEERLTFWKNVPFDLRTFIASVAMDRLGISPQSDVKLFQAG